MNVDNYHKAHLLKAIELYRYKKEGVDVWHEGRFIDKWAGDEIVSELTECFAHYDKDDILRALKKTHELFVRITRELAQMEGYKYPDEAEKCAKAYLGM